MLAAPVPGPPATGFDLPAGPYGPGSRGLRWSVTPGTAVRAPVDGTVTFVGSVVAQTWVSIRPRAAEGSIVTVGDVTDPTVDRGATVRAGDVVGRAGTSVYLGVRVDGVHVDPSPLLRARPAAVRLVPNRRFGDGGGCAGGPVGAPDGVVVSPHGGGTH